jgi:serine protease Do
MKRVALAGLSLACVQAWLLSPRGAAVARATPRATAPAASSAGAAPPAGPLCAGAYADDFAALAAPARDFDRHPEATFSYCTRSSAVYECLSYGPDATVRHERRKVVAHGTAFAYRRQAADTLLLTNDHVASWPVVTDAQHLVEGVPAGCKRTSESLALVDNEHDDYARDDIPVTRLVTDPQLDVAVLKAHSDLHVMPWKIGRSAAIHERNAVEVRGFPLGAFRATSLGKVISEHDHDDYGDWDHDDFVVDALLSAGNSGSPVLAVSCATGEYELVGIFHAGYTQGSALNVVIGIDQVRDFMTTLKRTTHEHVAEAPALDGALRARIDQAVAREQEIFFPFGGNVALVRRGGGGALLFAIFGRDFPLVAEPMTIVEDLASASSSSFGELGRVWFGSARGLKSYPGGVSITGDSDPTLAPPLARVLDVLRADAAAHVAYRGLQQQPSMTRQTSERLLRESKSLTRTAVSRADLLQSLVEAGERLAPAGDDPVTHFAELAPGLPSPVTPASPSAVTSSLTTSSSSSLSPLLTGGKPAARATALATPKGH